MQSNYCETRGCRTLTLFVFSLPSNHEVVPFGKDNRPPARYLPKEMSTSRTDWGRLFDRKETPAVGKPTEPTDTPLHSSELSSLPNLFHPHLRCSSGIVVPLGKLSRQVIVRRFGKEYSNPEKGPQSLVASHQNF